MPKILKKDIVNHIETFFDKQGKRLTNLKKSKIDDLYKIMEKYNIPPIDEDEISKEKEEEKENEEREKLIREREQEERQRNNKLGRLMLRIINTKLIKDFYKNDKDKFSKWRSYLKRKEIQDYHNYQLRYDNCVKMKENLLKDETFSVEIECRGKDWFLVANGIHMDVINLFEKDEIYEPYKKQEDISKEINPFKEMNMEQMKNYILNKRKCEYLKILEREEVEDFLQNIYEGSIEHSIEEKKTMMKMYNELDCNEKDKIEKYVCAMFLKTEYKNTCLDSHINYFIMFLNYEFINSREGKSLYIDEYM